MYKISTRRSASISTYSTLYFSKLIQDGTLERTFFDFFNSNASGKPIDKLRKTAKNENLISNALFITIETNKK